MTEPRRAFHITIHARPNGNWPTQLVLLEGRELQALLIPPAELNGPLGVSFEEGFESLSRFSRMFVEPDGSLVWVSDDPAKPPWQVDGVLYDRNGRLLYVELKGTCSRAAFGRLLAALGGSSIVVQLVRHAIMLDAEEFARQFLME